MGWDIGRRKMANKEGYKNLKNQVKFGINDAPKDAVKKALGSVLYWYKKEIPESDEEFAERLNEFFQHCYESNEIPTVEKLALSLGTTRQTLWDWESTDRKGRLVSDMIKHAKSMISAMDAELAMTGKIQPVVYIFRAKNYYGMRDQVDISAASEGSAGGAFFDQKALENRYGNMQISHDSRPDSLPIMHGENDHVSMSENEHESMAENVPVTGTKKG